MNPTLLREGDAQAFYSEGRIYLKNRSIFLPSLLDHYINKEHIQSMSSCHIPIQLSCCLHGQYPQLRGIIHQTASNRPEEAHSSYCEQVVQLNGHRNIIWHQLSDNHNREASVRWSGYVSEEGWPTFSAWYSIQTSDTPNTRFLPYPVLGHWSESSYLYSKWLCEIVEQLIDN